MRIKHLLWGIAGVASVLGASASAQTYPSKPIRIIVAIVVGSPSDIALRAAAQDLQASMGQPVLIENRPGGNNMIAPEACAKAAGDGYTLCVVSNAPMSLNPHIFFKLPYDPDKDFAPVTALWYLIQGLIASPSLPAKSIKELQTIAATKSGSINFGTLGEGTGGDILRQALNDAWKANMAGIPYKGANLLANALAGGEIQLGRISLNGLAGQVQAGKLRILAVSSSTRSRVFPDAPTFVEAGLGNFYNEKVWWGLFAPAATPDTTVKRINSEFLRLFRTPKFAEFLENQLFEPAVSSSEEFAAFTKEDRIRAGEIVRKYKIPKQ